MQLWTPYTPGPGSNLESRTVSSDSGMSISIGRNHTATFAETLSEAQSQHSAFQDENTLFAVSRIETSQTNRLVTPPPVAETHHAEEQAIAQAPRHDSYAKPSNTGPNTEASSSHKTPLGLRSPNRLIADPQPATAPYTPTRRASLPADLIRQSRTTSIEATENDDSASTMAIAGMSLQSEAVANAANAPASNDPAPLSVPAADQGSNPSVVCTNANQSGYSNPQVAPADLAFAVKIHGESSSLTPQSNDAALKSDILEASGNSAIVVSPSNRNGAHAPVGNIRLGRLSMPSLGLSVQPDDMPRLTLQSDPLSSRATKSGSLTGDAALQAEAVPDKAAEAHLPKLVQLQITGNNSQRVDIELRATLATMSLSVRTPDRLLTRELQANIAELSVKLAEQQVRSDFWMPFSNDARLAASGEPDPGGKQHLEMDGSRARQHNRQHEDQDNNRAPKPPDWVEELTQRSHLIKNGTLYSWHL